MTLSIPFLALTEREVNIELLSDLLDQMPSNKLAFTPWPANSGKPEVHFSIAYTYDHLFIKYYVSEKNLRLTMTEINEPVYKDSCVEFFVQWNGDPNYYNLEFNSVGICLGGYGPDRYERQQLSPYDLKQIISTSVITKSSKDPCTNWQLTLAIPVNIFKYQPVAFNKDTLARANFYKCGDDLPEPHFLCWSNIEADKPEFHLSQFFGNLHFT